MKLGSMIRITRQKAFCTQEEFAKDLGVALSTVNRWELNKVRPNVRAMKAMKAFCQDNGVSFEEIEREWLNQVVEEDEQ